MQTDIRNCVMESDQPFVCNLFGEFELYYKGRLQPEGIFQSVKARDLLIYMLNERRSVSKDEIIEAIWGEKDNKDPNNLFHVTLYKLRKSLKSVESNYEYIECSNRLYSIEDGLFRCIHEEFEDELIELLTGDEMTDEEAERVQRNISLYKNKYLYSYDYEWVHLKREYYHGIYERALLAAAGHYVGRSRFVQALGNLNILIKYNPYCEEAYMLMLSVYDIQGNKKQLVRTREAYLGLLTEDLGVEPSEKFKKFYSDLKNS